MGKFKDLTGMKFGRLTVLARAENDKHRHSKWLCRCECGNEVIVLGDNLTRGVARSCGCWHDESARERATKHDMCHSKAYRIWCHIKGRCLNPTDKAYPDYGGRGITMEPAWIEDFEKFYSYVSTLEHFGEENYSLDRINNEFGYFAGNLRWADRKTQNRNRRTNRLVEYGGQLMTLAEAAEKSGLGRSTLWRRIKAGTTAEDLFKPPIHISDETRNAIKADVEAGLSKAEAARRHGVDRKTVQRILKEQA